MADDIKFEASGFQSLKAQIREANLAYQALLADVNATPAAIAAAAAKVANLKDEFNDANDAVSALTQQGKFQALTKGLASVSGGFTAIQGAIGLVSDDTKAFEETFKKLQAAMALTQGLTALADLGDAFGAIKIAAVNAFNGIKVAFGSTGVGAVILAASALVGALIYKFSQANKEGPKVKTTEEAYKAFNDTLREANTLMDLRIARQRALATSEKEALENEVATREDNLVKLKALEEKATKEIGTLYKDLELKETEADKKSLQEKIDGEIAKRKIIQDEIFAEETAIIAGNKAIRKINQDALANKSKDKQAATDKDAKDTAKAEADAAKAEAEAEAARVKALDQRVKAELEANESARAVRLANAESDAAAIQIEYQNKREKLEENYKLDQIAAAGNAEALLLIDQKYADDQILLDKEVEAETAKLEDEADAKREEKRKKEADEKDKEAKDDIEREKQKNQAIFQMSMAAANDLVNSLQQLQNAQMAAELAAVEGNQAAQESIREEYFEKDKNFQYAKASLAAIQAGVQAFAQGMELGGPPLAALFLALSLASTSIQLAAISKTQYVAPTASRPEPKASPSTYADGGLLLGNSHDMGGIRTTMGELEGGEFVINRRATANFLPLLESINSLGNSPGPQVATAAQQPIVKTYVVASDMTSQQEANARLNALARL